MKGQIGAFPDIWKAKDQVICYLMRKTPIFIFIFLAKNPMYPGNSGARCVYTCCRLVTHVYIQKVILRGSIGASRQWLANLV